MDSKRGKVKMKKAILYIDSMQRGGAQRVMSVLSKFLSDRGIYTILVNDIIPDERKAEYSIDFRVHRVFLDKNRKLGRNKNIARVIGLRRLVKEENPDVILSFMGPPNYRMLLATIGMRCRKVISVRNDPYREYGTGLKKWIAGFIFRFADGCVFQTEQASEYFPAAVRKKGRIILNPVDSSFFNTVWKGEDKTILSVGRLYPQKNHVLLLNAFAQVHKKHPKYELKICGKGSEENNLKELASELGIDSFVSFMGEVGNVKDELKHSSCFVLSSDYEGLPNALMEAMAVGIPVISTDCPCGGPHTLIRHNENGILVPCGDVNGLADAIEEVISNKEKRMRLGQYGKESAAHFRTETVMGEWLEYLFTESEIDGKDKW